MTNDCTNLNYPKGTYLIRSEGQHTLEYFIKEH